MGKHYCCVCSNYRGKQVESRTVSLHMIPALKILRQAWLRRLRLVIKNFSYTRNSRVCSEHFVGHRGPSGHINIPSIFPNKIFRSYSIHYDKVQGITDQVAANEDDAIEVQTSICQSDRSFDELSVLLHDYCGPIPEASISSQTNVLCQNKKNEIQHLGEEHKNKKLKSQQSDDKCQMDSTSSSRKTSKMPVKQDSSSAQASQSMMKPGQVLTSPFQTTTRKTESLKQKFLVPNHQHCVMSNLVSMWKSRKFCDVSISNGSSTVMIHKVVLSAVSPKMYSVFSTYISSEFYEVKFPEVTTQTLMAFAEYIYTGLLDLDLNVLQQLRAIAIQLDMKDLENSCDVNLLNAAYQQPASTVTAFDDPKHMSSCVSNTMSKPEIVIQTSLLTPMSNRFVSVVTTEDIKQEISQNELPELQENTDGIFEQEIEGTSMETKDGNSPAGSTILPTVKIESVGPDDDKYGQMNIRTYTSSSVSDTSQALNTTLNPIAVSTTDFSLPFTDTTNNNTTANKIHGTSPKLKSDVSEGSLVSDLTSLSYSDEKLCSQSRLNKEEPSEPLNQTITTQSIDNNVTFGSNEGVYPVGLFTAGGDRLPLSSTQITSVKNIGLYKIDGFT